jgi:hypothetical protein
MIDLDGGSISRVLVESESYNDADADLSVIEHATDAPMFAHAILAGVVRVEAATD